MLLEVFTGIGIAALIFLFAKGINLLPFAIMIFFSYLLYDIMGKNNVFKKYAQVQKQQSNITFREIGGQDVAKKELKEALDFIREIDEIKRLGIRPLRGILLTGAPGNGKTLMAKAATSYIDSVFVTSSGSEFIEMYAGVGAQRIRQLFDTVKSLARKAKKRHGIIFIDEIEIIAGSRGRETSHLEYDQTLNQLLVEMDGISSNDECNILVIAATNRPDIIDPALLRPGRFDRIVRVDAPDKNGRLEILKLHTKDKPLDKDVNLSKIARETFGFSGAHLENLCNEAAILAMRECKDKISQYHFMEAIDKVILGEKIDRKPEKEELLRIAVHEGAHALISEFFNPNSVATVTITSRGQALGYVRQAAKEDKNLYTKDYLESQIAIALAGAVAEEIFMGTISTGASKDFEYAVDIAKKIIYSGMSSLGVVDKNILPHEALHKTISLIMKEQKNIVKEIIHGKKKILKKVADYLLENEKIDGNTLRVFLDKRVA